MNPPTPEGHPKDKKEAEKLSVIESKVIDYIMLSQGYLFRHFFGLDPHKEGISGEEQDRVNLYFHHAGLEVAKAYRATRFTKFQNFNQVTNKKFNSEEEEFAEFVDDYLFRLLGHDISHHSERIITQGKSQTPTPLLPGKQEEDINRESFKEELYAAIWMTQRGYEMPISLAMFQADFPERMNREISESEELQSFPGIGRDIVGLLPNISNDFDAYTKAYLAFVSNVKLFPVVLNRFFNSRIVYDENGKATPGSFDKAHKEWRVFLKELVKTSNDIESHPDEQLVEMLRYIFENKDNPRVLVDLFFKELGPYIKTLKPL